MQNEKLAYVARSAQIERVRTGDPVLYVNDARYQHLWNLLNDARICKQPNDAAPSSDVGDLIFREARFLDDRRYDEWLDLFSPECIYWVPSSPEPGDPRHESAIYLDDRRRLTDRVGLIQTGFLHAQTPPSRTRRMLCNIEQWTIADGTVHARANLVIWEYRKGQTRAHPGWQLYEVVRDASGMPMIGSKIVCLLDCDAPQGNYSFII